MSEESQEKSVKTAAGSTGFGRTEWVIVSAVVAVFILAYVAAAWLPDWVRAFFNATDAGAEGGGKFSVFGPIGDFFGGILNPILTFFTVFLLLQSLKLQRQELADTRAELARTAQANEDLAKSQKILVERAIQSANALTDAAVAQIESTNIQKINLRNQIDKMSLDVYKEELDRINYKIERYYEHSNANTQIARGNGDFIFVPNPLSDEEDGETDSEKISHLRNRERFVVRNIESLSDRLKQTSGNL